MHNRVDSRQEGFTIVELLVAGTVLAFMATSLLTLFGSLVASTNLTKRRAVASTLATNQMEYIKSLPFDRLAVSGGAIVSATPLPATTTQTLERIVYTITTSINYVDDAFDGCGSYPTPALKIQYCRNLPEPAGAPAIDTNPQDYKIVHVKVTTPKNPNLAEVDTQISARVSETSSTTGAMFATVLDDTGNPVSGATVQVVNTTTSPAVNVSDSTDVSGNAIFYGLPPDTTGYDYVVTASKSGYSTLTTVAPTVSLVPNYPNKQIFTQLSSVVALVIKPMGANSLWAEVYNTSGSPVSNFKINTKGGYKKYNSATDTSYYFDSSTPTDTRLVTDSSGNATFANLVPGDYIFCGDNSSTGCTVGATNYYLLAAVPYGGTNSFSPTIVPTYTSSYTAPTFDLGGTLYYQKVRLIVSTDSQYPRISSLSPDDVSLATSGLSSYSITIKGANLPCSSIAGSCATTVRFTQGSIVRTASCTGAAAGLQLNCTVDLSGLAVGSAYMSVTANSRTLTLPDTPLLGGFNVTL
jgi:type II secretory pathway pseudopilin PulG